MNNAKTTKLKLNLLSVGQDTKTIKGQKYGFLTGVLYLAPASLSGRNLCPWSTAGCRAACLFTAGRGHFKDIISARVAKTHKFIHDRAWFLDTLSSDLERLRMAAVKRDMIPCVRLNGTADISWEKIPFRDFDNIMGFHDTIRFYDYTKGFDRVIRSLDPKTRLHNHHLTFSRSESNEDDCKRILDCGGSVAMVFRERLPEKWLGFDVVNGDQHDVRFIDPAPCIVGLVEKGKAKNDSSGFVIDSHL